MGNEWKKVRLSKIFKIIGGGTPKTKIEEYWNGDISWLSVKDFNNENRKVYFTEKTITNLGLEKSSTKLLEKGDLIISARGTVGELAQLGKEMTFNQSCYGLRTNELSTNDFMYYALKNILGDIKRNTHGSVFDTITKETFNVLNINLPPLETQKKIAEILSSLDDKIEINNQMNKTLEEMAQAIFKQWFVDFEFPNENGEAYKSSGGEMVESELGLIPKGWRVGTLSEIINVNPKETLKKGSVAKYIEMKSLSENNSIIEIPIERKFKGSGSKFKNKDVLLARITPCLENGKTGYINFFNDEEVGWGSTEFIVLRSKNGVPNEIPYIIARDENFRNHLISNMIGSSGRQRVPIDRVNNYPFTIPQNIILTNFNNIVKNVFIKIKINREESIYIREMLNTLLPKLMSGKVEFREWGEENDI